MRLFARTQLEERGAYICNKSDSCPLGHRQKHTSVCLHPGLGSVALVPRHTSNTAAVLLCLLGFLFPWKARPFQEGGNSFAYLVFDTSKHF